MTILEGLIGDLCRLEDVGHPPDCVTLDERQFDDLVEELRSLSWFNVGNVGSPYGDGFRVRGIPIRRMTLAR